MNSDRYLRKRSDCLCDVDCVAPETVKLRHNQNVARFQAINQARELWSLHRRDTARDGLRNDTIRWRLKARSRNFLHLSSDCLPKRRDTHIGEDTALLCQGMAHCVEKPCPKVATCSKLARPIF